MATKYLTVSAITQYIKKKFDVDPYLGRVYMTGEISNFRLRPTHQYFSLKDDNSKMNVIMFKSAFDKVKFIPEEGMKVLVTGRIGLYEKTGQYQLYIDHMEPDGVGQLYEAYEQLKKKLAQEGLFDQIHKKPIPKYPKKIAVITSESGSVIKDIITTARRRYPIAQIVLFPAAVQGENAAPEIANQINRVNEIGGFDTMIIGRGGGSIEDLWPFNDEKVARAIYNSEVPVISSVGHETDTTIADLVSDQRAATPTAAAELAVPVLSDILLDVRKNQTRLFNAMNNIIGKDRIAFNKIKSSYVFRQPERLYESYVQQLDGLNDKLVTDFKNNLNGSQRKLERLYGDLKFNSPIQKISTAFNELSYENQGMVNAMQRLFKDKVTGYRRLVNNLDHLSPLKIMGAGYTMVTSHDGNIINSADKLAKGEEVELNFKDGKALTTVDKVTKKGES